MNWEETVMSPEQKAGIKEVVDWIKENIVIPYPVGSVGYLRWQDKLRDWGL